MVMKVQSPAPAAMTNANSSFRPEPCPSPPKSVIGSLPCSPALYASHKTTNSATTSIVTINHRVEFKRPFITSLLLLCSKSQQSVQKRISCNFKSPERETSPLISSNSMPEPSDLHAATCRNNAASQ